MKVNKTCGRSCGLIQPELLTKSARGIVDIQWRGDGGTWPCGKCVTIGGNAEWMTGLPRTVNDGAKATARTSGGALPPLSSVFALALRPRDQISL